MICVSRKYFDGSREGGVLWECICDCGKKIDLRSSLLLRPKNLKHCQCEECKELEKKTHKLTKSYIDSERIRNIWNCMKSRCYNKNNPRYHNYGGRGIKICEEWRYGSKEFIDWSLNVSNYQKDFTIERNNINKDYEPSNCRWIPFEEQANNRTNTIRITYQGKTQNVAQWAKELGISSHRVYCDIESGITDPELLFIQKEQHKAEFQSGHKNITWNKWRDSWMVRYKQNEVKHFKNVEDAIEYKNKLIEENKLNE